MLSIHRLSISGRKLAAKLAETVDYGLDSILSFAKCSPESQFY
jgi:hypothetical protein